MTENFLRCIIYILKGRVLRKFAHITGKMDIKNVKGIGEVREKQYKKLFEMDNVEIEFDDSALKAVAEKSIERKTGARGLRSIMEEIMTDIMYEIPSRKEIKKVIITEKCITEKAEPEYVIE